MPAPSLQAALQKAVGERRVQEAILNVAVGNAPALRLYRRLGFADGALVEDYYAPVRNESLAQCSWPRLQPRGSCSGLLSACTAPAESCIGR